MKVLQIKPCANVSLGLRNIADQIDNNGIEQNDCTVIIGSEIFHLGVVSDEEAATQAIFNMTFGIHKLMNAAVTLSED